MRMSLCMCTISLLVLISTVTVQAHIYSFFLLTIVLMFVNNLTAGKLNRKFYRVSRQNPCTIAAIDWLKIKGYFIVVVLQHSSIWMHITVIVHHMTINDQQKCINEEMTIDVNIISSHWIILETAACLCYTVLTIDVYKLSDNDF